MASRPTIAQVAELAGVSIATVSRYINSSKGVKAATAQRISKAIQALEYPLPEDTTKETNSSKTILINIPTVSNPFYNEIIRGIQNSALRHGYQALVNIQHLNVGTEAAFLDLLQTGTFAGAIILNVLEPQLFDRVRKTLPMVQCCEFLEGQDLVSYVSIDDVAAAKKMMEYLFSIQRKKVAFLMGPSRYKYARHRKTGYIQALEAARIPVNPDWIIPVPDLQFDTAFSAVMQLLSQKDRPNAIFAVSDVLAAAAIRACQKSGLTVPEDIAVAGFDNIPYSQVINPPITTINQPKFNLGYTACELLIEQLTDPQSKPQKLLLNTELIIREST